MSKCISPDGEYSEHRLADHEWSCERCDVQPEDIMQDVLDQSLRLIHIIRDEFWLESAPTHTPRRDRLNWIYGEIAQLIGKAPVPPKALPTEPGYYVGDYKESPSGKILIELLNSPAGQWVDNTDSQYLEDDWVRELENLTRLVPASQDVET